MRELSDAEYQRRLRKILDSPNPRREAARLTRQERRADRASGGRGCAVTALAAGLAAAGAWGRLRGWWA